MPNDCLCCPAWIVSFGIFGMQAPMSIREANLMVYGTYAPIVRWTVHNKVSRESRIGAIFSWKPSRNINIRGIVHVQLELYFQPHTERQRSLARMLSEYRGYRSAETAVWSDQHQQGRAIGSGAPAAAARELCESPSSPLRVGCRLMRRPLSSTAPAAQGRVVGYTNGQNGIVPSLEITALFLQHSPAQSLAVQTTIDIHTHPNRYSVG
jgi:hypothetical protein